MLIALLSTSAVAVPPRAYGGTERFVADLAEALVARGHDVTVYATGDSRPAGHLRWRFGHAYWPPNPQRELEHVTWAWGEIAGGQFDVVHINGPESLIAAERVPIPTVLTIHHSHSVETSALMRSADKVHLVAISRRQAELAPELAVSAVIHHGLSIRMYPAGRGAGGYAAFLGRLAPEKAPHVAIDAAAAAGVPLRLAGPSWGEIPGHAAYFQESVKPRLERSGSGVTWVGEVDHPGKVALVGDARALLVPLEWEEPFGLVMIEAMLVGTPVIAFARGSAPEIIDEGVTGFLVHDAGEMAARLAEVDRIDRRACRKRALERWNADRMAEDYERLYRRVAGHEEPVGRMEPALVAPAQVRWGMMEGSGEETHRPRAGAREPAGALVRGGARRGGAPGLVGRRGRAS